MYKLSDALFHFYRTTLSTSVVPTTSTFLSPIAIINRFLPFNLANWIPFLSLDASAASTYLTKWIFWDWVVIALVMWLRVPGLRYGRVKGCVYAVLFALFDALIFGTLGVSSYLSSNVSSLTLTVPDLGRCRQPAPVHRKRCAGIPNLHVSLSDHACFSNHQYPRTGDHARQQGRKAVEGN